jgi:hypothetical protein
LIDRYGQGDKLPMVFSLRMVQTCELKAYLTGL